MGNCTSRDREDKVMIEEDAPYERRKELNQGRLKISLVHGKIIAQQADIIVCKADKTLNLKKDDESKKLLHAAGKEIQNELHTKYPEGIEDGKIAVVGGGKLQCQKVYFVSLPEDEDSSSDDTEMARSIISACFEKADEGNFTTVALPVIPSMDARNAEAFINAVCASLTDFNNRHKNSTLQHVTIVYGDGTVDIMKAFTERLKKSHYIDMDSIEMDEASTSICEISNDPNRMPDDSNRPTDDQNRISAGTINTEIGTLYKSPYNSDDTMIPQPPESLTLLKEASEDAVYETEKIEADSSPTPIRHCYVVDAEHNTRPFVNSKQLSYDDEQSSENEDTSEMHDKQSQFSRKVTTSGARKVSTRGIEETGESSGILLIGQTTYKIGDNVLEDRVQTFRKLPCDESKSWQFSDNSENIQRIMMTIQELVQDNGVKSAVTLSAINTLCATVEEKYFKGKIKKWIPGYEHVDKPSDLVLVAIVTEEVPNIPKFPDFHLIQRKFGEVSDEAKNLFEKEKEDQYRFTNKESIDMRRCITATAKSLMKEHSNLLIVRGSKVRPNKEKPELCIVLYVHVKGIIPFGEEPFPKTLYGFEIEILEGIFYFAVNPKGLIPNLMMGCFLESSHRKGGSIGGFVKLQDGSLGCLTACHIFRPEIGTENFIPDVYQPKNPAREAQQIQQTHFRFGKVVKYSFAEEGNEIPIDADSSEITIDAALIKITNERRYPKSGRFPDAESIQAGFSPDNPMRFDCGTIVKSFDEIPKRGFTVSKYGAASGHTVGVLNQEAVAVRGLEDTLVTDIFRGQLEVFPLQGKGHFATQGDSGCLAFVIIDGNPYTIKALGMVIGTYSYNKYCVVTPMWAILQKFNLPLQLLSFPVQTQDESMEEDD